jgi:predicted O-linked N-acetylglucosamine transferase (SPINDLY family)
MTNMVNTLPQAVGLLQSGRVEDALRQLASLASAQPANADVFSWLAIANVRARNIQDAQRAIEQAIALNPANSGFYLTAANVQQDLGNLPAAVDLLRQAIRIDPAFAEGHNNLGIILTDLGRIDDAIPAFVEAIRLKPGYARAHANLAAAQLRSLQFNDALASARRAVELQPDYAHAHHLTGSALVMIGDSAAAETALRTALRLKPDFVEASLLLAKTLMKLKRSVEAEQVLQQALSLSPARAEPWTVLGEIAAERDDLPAALAAYQRSLELRPNDLSTTARAAVLLPNVYASEAHLDACRDRMTQGIGHLRANADVLSKALQPERFGDAISNSFLLAYQGRNDRDLQRGYADFVGKVAQRALPRELQAMPRHIPQGRRIRLGFCSRFFYRSTAGNYFASWITDLDRSVFEVFLYHTHVVEDDLTMRLRAASDHFVQAEESFAFFLKQIRADQLDILIYPEVGMDRIVYLLAAMRLAPIQICGWGHPVTPGHRTIDYFLSCAEMEPPGAQAHYNERLLTLPGIGTRYELPRISAQVAAKTRADYQLPEDAHIYLFPQSLFKVHPANDRLLVAAIANDPGSLLVMFAGQNQFITQKFVSRLSAAFAAQGLPTQGRVKILPGVGHDDYKRINQLSDLMLDTLHWSGGNTSLDALAMGLPIVTLPGEFMRGRQTMAMLKLLGVEELIAQSPEDYLAIARKLGTDRQYRDQVSQRILANRARLFDDVAPPRALGQILARLALEPADADLPSTPLMK